VTICLGHRLVLFTWLSMVSFDSRSSEQTSSWPILQTSSEVIAMDLRNQRTLVRVDLRDLEGKSRYQVVCFSGAESAVQEFGLIYSGGLMCGLAPTGTPIEVTLGNRSLLSDGATGAIFSRGNFNPEAMVGFCAAYPDYGLTRDFFLRGFRLTLSLLSVEVATGYTGGSEFRRSFTNENRTSFPIGRIKLRVAVSPDSKFLSSYAFPSRYTDPKGNQDACTYL